MTKVSVFRLCWLKKEKEKNYQCSSVLFGVKIHLIIQKIFLILPSRFWDLLY